MAKRSMAAGRPREYTDRWPDGPFDRRGPAQGQAAAEVAGRFVRALISRRDELRLSRAALARQVGLHEQTLMNIELGRTWPDFLSLVTLAEHLDLAVTLSSGPEARSAR